jgi:hypothetical protein
VVQSALGKPVVLVQVCKNLILRSPHQIPCISALVASILRSGQLPTSTHLWHFVGDEPMGGW